MLKAQAFGGGDSRKRPNLVRDCVFDFLGGGPHFAPAEPHEVRKSGMRPHSDAVLASQRDRGPHNPRVSCMETARNIRRRNEWNQVGVMP
jgi:hypothetical protein